MWASSGVASKDLVLGDEAALCLSNQYLVTKFRGGLAFSPFDNICDILKDRDNLL